MEQTKINPDRLNAFMGQFMTDYGAAMHAPTIIIGEKLGLYRALADGGPLSSKELADRTGTNERYVREWLAAQAASGYICYDANTRQYFLSPEQAFTLADENSPAYLPGAFEVIQALFIDEAKITEAFRTGQGVGWDEHTHQLFEGTDKFFGANYLGNLVNAWLPALEGVVPKLQSGARVADIGCGYGASTILMAKAFPNSAIVGYDFHAPSIQAAREAAARQGLAEQVQFEVSSAKEYPGRDYDLVTAFDCLHDLGDPLGAAQHVRRSLKADGTWMIVEPFANERLEENFNPVGRICYSASTLICTPASLSQEVGLALGAQVSDSRWREILLGAGFKSFRRAAETPFNRVFEVRP